ncbi:MAG: flagellar biosynthetic protein FliR, partial [Methylococcales bacterium]|nr:flagellar biosynthetic protein FliR [Methylococcales bacterium]
MNFTEAQLLNTIAMLTFPLMRISAMFVSMPIFGVKAAPARVRVMLAGVISFLVMPLLPPLPQIEMISYEGMMIGF